MIEITMRRPPCNYVDGCTCCPHDGTTDSFQCPAHRPRYYVSEGEKVVLEGWLSLAKSTTLLRWQAAPPPRGFKSRPLRHRKEPE